MTMSQRETLDLTVATQPEDLSCGVIHGTQYIVGESSPAGKDQVVANRAGRNLRRNLLKVDSLKNFLTSAQQELNIPVSPSLDTISLTEEIVAQPITRRAFLAKVVEGALDVVGKTTGLITTLTSVEAKLALSLVKEREQQKTIVVTPPKPLISRLKELSSQVGDGLTRLHNWLFYQPQTQGATLNASAMPGFGLPRRAMLVAGGFALLGTAVAVGVNWLKGLGQQGQIQGEFGGGSGMEMVGSTDKLPQFDLPKGNIKPVMLNTLPEDRRLFNNRPVTELIPPAHLQVFTIDGPQPIQADRRPYIFVNNRNITIENLRTLIMDVQSTWNTTLEKARNVGNTTTSIEVNVKHPSGNVRNVVFLHHPTQESVKNIIETFEDALGQEAGVKVIKGHRKYNDREPQVTTAEQGAAYISTAVDITNGLVRMLGKEGVMVDGMDFYLMGSANDGMAVPGKSDVDFYGICYNPEQFIRTIQALERIPYGDIIQMVHNSYNNNNLPVTRGNHLVLSLMTEDQKVILDFFVYTLGLEPHK